MLIHPICNYLPPQLAENAEHRVSISNVAPSKTEVPRKAGDLLSENRGEYSKFYDAFFFGQLFSVYQSGVFVRGNLDAGRLNSLIEQGVVEIVADDHDLLSADAELRLKVAKGIELFGNMTGSPSFSGTSNDV